MDWTLIFFTTYEVIMAVLFGLLLVFFSIVSLNRFFLRVQDHNELKQGNIAVAIFAGSIVVSIIILAQSSILPAVDALRYMVLNTKEISFSIIVISLGYFVLFFVISTVFSILFIFLASSIYMKATTKIDEVAEIKNNNIAVSVMMSMVLLSLAIYIQPSTKNFISSLIDYKNLQTLNQPEKNQSADKKVQHGEKIHPKKKIMPE